jgi:hypothetical protein
METNTPKQFVLQLGSLISLYLSLGFLVSLVFCVINLKFPDAIDNYWELESAASGVRLGIAMVMVFFPTYILLTRQVNKERRAVLNGQYLNLTKWLIYLSLLVGGLILLADLVSVIMTFLEGEMTQRFIYKALTVLVVTGMAFHYYILDAKNFWVKNEDKSILFGIGACIAVALLIVFSFNYIKTPAQARELKLDETQISDLQQIQWRVTDFAAAASSTLPNSLEEAFIDTPVPPAPESREPYTYEVTESGFRLCASFVFDSQSTNAMPVMQDFDDNLLKPENNWNYRKGRHCFDRTLD